MKIFRPCVVSLLLAGALAVGVPRASQAQVAVSITVAPPELPVYAQPAIPGPGYLWTPGYWAWGPHGYYWVPGTWVLPPRVGLLWTPGWWDWGDGVYLWHPGYWGPHVGFYGGVNYGFGYVGVGYFGGFWDHDRFRYNDAVNNIHNVHVTNVYHQTTVNNIDITRNVNVTRVSYNGGASGLAAQPTENERAAGREAHVAPTALQSRHETAARGNPAMRASANQGRPAIAATPRPGAFGAKGVVHAEGAAPYRPQSRPGMHPAGTAGPHPPGSSGQPGEQHQRGGPPGDNGGRPEGGPGGEDHPHP